MYMYYMHAVPVEARRGLLWKEFKGNLVRLSLTNKLWTRDGSIVNSTGCSYRGQEFNSQDLHGSSQPLLL